MNGPAAVVVCVHDGWYGCGTGAGASNRALLQTLVDQLPASVRLVVMPVLLTPDSSEHDPAWHRDMRALVARVDAQVQPVDNGAGGRNRFVGLHAFRRVCEHAAQVLTTRILPAAGPVLLLPIDAPFLGLPAQLGPFRPDLRVVLVPRSTGALHDPLNTERVAWEQTGLRAAVAAGSRVAAISRHMRRHLADAYTVPAHALIDLPTG